MSLVSSPPPDRTEYFVGYIMKMPGGDFLSVHWMQRSDNTCFGIYDMVKDFSQATAMPKHAIPNVLQDMKLNGMAEPVALLEMSIVKTFTLKEVPLNDPQDPPLLRCPEA